MAFAPSCWIGRKSRNSLAAACTFTMRTKVFAQAPAAAAPREDLRELFVPLDQFEKIVARDKQAAREAEHEPAPARRGGRQLADAVPAIPKRAGRRPRWRRPQRPIQPSPHAARIHAQLTRQRRRAAPVTAGLQPDRIALPGMDEGYVLTATKAQPAGEPYPAGDDCPF